MKTIFKVSAFRPHQEELIDATMQGRDVFAVLPTGSGKSLCFQLPAVLSKGVTVIVTPLIALMRDQVLNAKTKGIPAEAIHSALSRPEMSEIYRTAVKGELKLLYISPERLKVDSFRDIMAGMHVSRIVLDECHCLSAWGCSFRPAYLDAAQYISEGTDYPVSAYTATATVATQDDIMTRLGMKNAFVVRGNMDRPNLYYQVSDKLGDGTGQCAEYAACHPDQCGIIYRTTRNEVEHTAKYLAFDGIRAAPYHAGLEKNLRHQTEVDFIKGDIQVIVATIAFGMGIDKPDCRYVIHADIPKNIEGYCQEAGRAGRDGKPAHCLFLYSVGDVSKVRRFIDNMEDPYQRDVSYEQFIQILNYAKMKTVCRRKMLLKYFGQEYGENCGMCDVCNNKKQVTGKGRK